MGIPKEEDYVVYQEKKHKDVFFMIPSGNALKIIDEVFRYFKWPHFIKWCIKTLAHLLKSAIRVKHV